jgi:hypothetical protein
MDTPHLSDFDAVVILLVSYHSRAAGARLTLVDTITTVA